MKILRIRVNGLPLYKEPFDVSFYAVQRVQSKHMDSVYYLGGNIYVNTAEAFAGINASGKTTTLKVISFVSALLGAVPLNSRFVPQILEENKKAVFDIDFFADNRIFHLKSQIIRSRNSDDRNNIKIVSEELWEKSITSKVNKSNLLSYDGLEPSRVRDNSDEYLPDDVSIMIAVRKQANDNSIFVDLVGLTNINLFVPRRGDVLNEIIMLLDPTIEYITTENVNDGQYFVGQQIGQRDYKS